MTHSHQDALKHALFELVTERLESYCLQESLCREELARRLGKNRIDVERMLKSPRYWTLEIVADFLNAMECDLELRLIPNLATLAMTSSSQAEVALT